MATEPKTPPIAPLVLNLPKSESLTYQPPTEAGVWTAYDDPETLHKVADGIASSHEQRSPHSIPDVWKRAAVFADVLRDASTAESADKRTVLQNRVVAEWRGMLAILALWKVRQWNWLQVEPINLIRPDLNGRKIKKLSFVEVLEKLQPSQPSEFVLQDVTWKEFHILVGPKGQPFGFTSPMSLVCTAQDCTGRIQGIPWMVKEENEEFLIDPLTGDYLKSQEKGWLAQWLAGLRKQIQEQLPKAAGRHVPMVTLLQEYEKAANGGELAQPLAASELSDAGLGISSPSTRLVYGPMDKPVGTVGYLENRIIVLKGKKAEVLAGGEIGNTPSEVETPIPPLRKQLLQDFSPAELAKGLTMRWTENKRIIVELKLDWSKSLTHPEQKGRIVESHEYGENDILEIDPLNVPVVNIWPNFVRKQWGIYYTYISLTGGPESGVLRMRPMFEDQKDADHEYFSPDGTGFAVYETNEFPRALICTYEFHNDETDRQDGVTAVLPLQQPGALPESTRSDNAFIAGVDFGSTGSVIFLHRESVQSPEPKKLHKLTFKPRLVKVAGGKAYEWRTDREFLPVDDNPAASPYSGQILSVYQMHTQPPRDNPPRPLSEGHVLYLKEYDKFIEPGTKRVSTNLKWGGNTEILLTESFLRQICLQTAAEALEEGAQRVTWRFSYPTAFAPDKVAAFNAKWSRVADFVKKHTGIDSEASSHGEAVAAGCYFAQGGPNMSISTGALSIDIGGGTSDYSFWRNENLQLHNSVLLAGRDIFLTPLRRRPEFLSQLDSELGKSIKQIKDLEKTDQNAANAQMDAIIARKGDELREKLINHSDERNVREFCRLIETGLAGILYYGGLLLRYQMERGTFKPDEGRFGVYVGGNGCKLFDWAAGHTFNTDASDCASRLKEAFRAASGLDPKTRIEIGLSPMPKSEVACGLILPKIVSDVNHAGDLIACERFESGASGSGAWHEWNTAPDKADVLKNGIHVDPKLPEFAKFLAAIGVNLSPSQLKDLETRINNRLAALRAPMAHDQDGIAETILRGEPVWVVAFKLFFEDQVNAWIQTAVAAKAS